jgi:hypothetical protein
LTVLRSASTVLRRVATVLVTVLIIILVCITPPCTAAALRPSCAARPGASLPLSVESLLGIIVIGVIVIGVILILAASLPGASLLSLPVASLVGASLLSGASLVGGSLVGGSLGGCQSRGSPSCLTASLGIWRLVGGISKALGCGRIADTAFLLLVGFGADLLILPVLQVAMSHVLVKSWNLG